MECELFWYRIRWQSIYTWASIQYTLTLPKEALITVFPTQRQATVRKLRNLNWIYHSRISSQNKNGKRCNQSKSPNDLQAKQEKPFTVGELCLNAVAKEMCPEKANFLRLLAFWQEQLFRVENIGSNINSQSKWVQVVLWHVMR